MSIYQAKPMSRMEISKLANTLRKLLKLDDIFYVDVVRLLELALPEIGVDYDIIEKSRMPQEALAVPEESLILIRDDVYHRAIKNDGRARFTIIHEIGHFLMHKSNRISFARGNSNVPVYMDPEWQANVFAGEFLMPYDLVKDMDVESVIKKCGVTRSAAQTQLSHHRKRLI